jgi:hypothetical protein
MNCEECQKKLMEYLTGDLSSEVRSTVCDHLEACAACAGELAELREMWQVLGTLPDEEPSPELGARFYAMLEAAKAQQAAAHAEGREGGVPDGDRRQGLEGWLTGWWPRRPALQFATALVLLALGMMLGTGLRPDDRRDVEMAMLRAEIQSMRQVMTLALVHQTASGDRLAAISSIRKDEEAAQPAIDALILALKSDPNVNVRLAAVDALSGFLDRRSVRDEMNRALVSQTSPMVQVSLIEALSGAEDEQLFRTLQSIAQDERADPIVREHARMRIEKKL